MGKKKKERIIPPGKPEQITQELRENEELQLKELGEEVDALLNQEVSDYNGYSDRAGYNTKANNLFATIYNQVIAGDYELPDLPYRMREFAFRWMTEYRTVKDWAKIFNVTPHTIYLWRNHPKVVKYAAVIKYKRNALIVERSLQLENKAYTKMQELLDLEITDGNVESIRKVILDTLNIIQQRIPRSSEPVAQINNITTAAVQNTNIHKKTEVNIGEIREKLDEMELIEKILDKKNGGNDEP